MGGKKILILIPVVIAAGALAIAILFFMGGKDRKLSNQLSLGQKYLDELNYEEAIACFDKALEINPMSAEAYLGKADAYIGMGDLDAAKAVLEKGIETIDGAGMDSSLLKAKLAEVNEELESRKKGDYTEEAGILDSEIETEEVNYPSISIEPIMNELNNVWGRSWLDWTVEDFVAEYSLAEEDVPDGEYWSDGVPTDPDKVTFHRYAYIRSGEKVICDDYNKHVSGYEYKGRAIKILHIKSDSRKYLQLIWDGEVDVPVDDLTAFLQNNGINGIDDVAPYFGIDDDAISDINNPLHVNTEYGTATMIKRVDEEKTIIEIRHTEEANNLHIQFEERYGDESYFRIIIEQGY